MKKIKIFYNPIEQIPIWLNKYASQGYKLTSVQNCFYSFEKTQKKLKYSVRFIGYDPNESNISLIDELEHSGFKTFRAPLNQLNIAIGKIKYRPLASNGARISTSYDNYNKEILIIESDANYPDKYIIPDSEKASSFKNLRNTYFYGIVPILFIALAVIIRFVKNNFTIDMLTVALSILIIFLLIFILTLSLRFHKKYKSIIEDNNLY